MTAVTRGRRRYRIPRGLISPEGGPFDPVLRLERRGYRREALAVSLGLGLHVGLFLLAQLVPPPPPATVRREIAVIAAAPPPAPPAPAPEPPPKRVQARRPLREARPAAAQASKVVARTPDPSEPLDFTGFTMVTGESRSFAGGITASNGKSQTAVTDPNASGRGVVGSHGHSELGSLAKPPAPARRDWACSWPEDAQESDLKDARVSVRVSVDRDGAPAAVQILAAPAPSFADAARRCALAEVYRPALDVAGRRIGGTTPLFVVHFVR